MYPLEETGSHCVFLRHHCSEFVAAVSLTRHVCIRDGGRGRVVFSEQKILVVHALNFSSEKMCIIKSLGNAVLSRELPIVVSLCVFVLCFVYNIVELLTAMFSYMGRSCFSVLQVNISETLT